jgi:hypothetical protein
VVSSVVEVVLVEDVMHMIQIIIEVVEVVPDQIYD